MGKRPIFRSSDFAGDESGSIALIFGLAMIPVFEAEPEGLRH